MPQKNESSVSFSLRELMSLEEQRVLLEAAEKVRSEEVAEQARREADERALADSAAHARAEEEGRVAAAQREREASARLQAIHAAEIERARLDAETASRLETIRHHQEHERHLASLKHDSSKKRLKFAVFGVATVLIFAVVGGAVALRQQHQTQLQAEAKHRAEVIELEAKLDSQDRRVRDLTSAVQNAKDEGERMAAQARLEAAQREREEMARAVTTATTSKLRSNSPASPAKAPQHAACKCTPGDPLCSCL